jgi:hypothetical protein
MSATARRMAAWASASAWLVAVPGMDGGCSVVNSPGNLTPERDRGAIVVGGLLEGDPRDVFVLTALDPLTGKELTHARLPMTVAGVEYDGDRPNLWYVFESGTAGHFFPLPSDAFYVHVMQLDAFDGTWTELAALSIPPAVSFSTTTVLKGSIAYVAYDGPTGRTKLVILDTSIPSAIRESDELSIPASIPPTVALLGARSSSGTQYVMLCATRPPRGMAAGATDAGANGGASNEGSSADDGAPVGDEPSDDDAAVSDASPGDDALRDASPGDDALGDEPTDDGALAADAPIEGGAIGDGATRNDAARGDAGSMTRPGGGGGAPRSATLTEYSVSGGMLSTNPVGTASVSPIGFGLVGFASITTRASTKPLVLVVANAGVTTATVSLYDPFAGLSPAGTGQFPFGDGNAQPPAFSKCDNYAFAIGTNADTLITAIDFNPLVSGPGDTLDLTATPERTGNSGQGLYFEPYTGTVVAPFVVGANVNFNAFYFRRGADGTAQLTQRQADWHPPPALRPNFVVAKVPVDFPCPAAP